MERPSLWLSTAVVVLLGLLFLQQPWLRRYDEVFLHWLIKNAAVPNKAVPLMIVEIGNADSRKQPTTSELETVLQTGGSVNSPLECALLVQAALDFQPAVIGFEPVLQWPEQAKEQEQIFVDQAMRVPELLLAAELTATPDPDAPVADVSGFPHVTGKRGNLVEFSGVARQPSEDVRLLSKLGFINLPGDASDEVRAPLLFQYRGEVVPSFALEAVLLWLRVPHEEVRIAIGDAIELPQGRKIPIEADGTIVVNRNAANLARRLTSNELLLAAQQREQGKPPPGFNDLANSILLARPAADAAQQGDIFAAAIATIQAQAFVRRANWIFDCAILAAISLVAGAMGRLPRLDLILLAISCSAAYCLVALGVLSRWSIWLPGLLPLLVLWVAVVLALVLPRRSAGAEPAAVVASPPLP